jgi:hypothetical protein
MFPGEEVEEGGDEWRAFNIYRDRLWKLLLGVSDDTSGCMLRKNTKQHGSISSISGPYPTLNWFLQEMLMCRPETGPLNCQPLCTIEVLDCALLFLLFIATLSSLHNNNVIWWIICRKLYLEVGLC